MITVTDRNMLMRCARIIRQQADALHATHAEDWPKGLKAKEKRDHERLLREERDLRAFIKRMESQGLIEPPAQEGDDKGEPATEGQEATAGQGAGAPIHMPGASMGIA